MANFASGFLRWYSRLLYNYPLAFIIVSVILTGVLPLICLYFWPVHLTNNAEIGFDTKDTDYSGPRLAWQQLQQHLTSSNRIPFANSGEKDPNVPPVLSPASNKTTRRRIARGWADDLLFAVQNVPCYDAPIPLMNHLSQIVVEVPSFDSIFEKSFLSDLCYLHANASSEITAFDGYTPYRNVWSVANMFACLSPNFLVNCTELTVEDINIVRDTVKFCAGYRDQLVSCKVECSEACTECPGVPKNCTNQMMFDVFYRILPQDLSSKPFLVNTFLPVFTLTGYATQNIRVPVDLYDGLENAIISYTSRTSLKLKGILMDIKRERLLKSAMTDSILALVAATLTMLVVALHSRSILYALAVFVILGLSVTGALAVYAQFTSDFPLLNLVIFVLLIAVGTDDAFLLFSSFPENLNEHTFYTCLSHTGATMFLTSFSTVVPFFLNMHSNVIVFRCFGLFAGMTTVVNWFLVVSFLPAFLLLQRRWCKCLPSLPKLDNWFSFSFRNVLPSVILQGRFVWLASLSLVVIGGCFITYNDFHLPEYNPLQLFVSSNLHEWYDNNAEKNFEFVASKIALPLFARVLYGIQKGESTARFKAESFTPLRYDPGFHLDTVPAIEKLANDLKVARNLPYINHTSKFWPERFLDWSRDYKCQAGFLCCNMSSPLFSNMYLDHCLRNSTAFLFTSYNDTPIFDNTTFLLTGYTALLPTKLQYSHRFSKLYKAFDLLSNTAKGPGFWAPEWPLMSTWFDLQRSIISDCRYSVIISISVVALFALAQLHLQALPAVLTCICIICTSVGVVTTLGWVLGVLEAVILVLVVGLSFDYTLHYGAALPHDGCPTHRVMHAASVALSPVSLAAFTSFLAGACMLFAQTHAFFQVGTFLVVVTSVSWIYATFFFLPLLSLTLPKTKNCHVCNSPPHIPLNRKF
ncbi:unnamed protein product [Auanema sp. JU1783]|nr:unnamed protein product [Auanema sp. JU1783]